MDSETTEDGALVCTADATAVLRLKSGGAKGYQAHVFAYKRLPACEPHGEYLAEDAQIEWEFLDRFLEPDEVEELTMGLDNTPYPEREDA